MNASRLESRLRANPDYHRYPLACEYQRRLLVPSYFERRGPLFLQLGRNMLQVTTSETVINGRGTVTAYVIKNAGNPTAQPLVVHCNAGYQNDGRTVNAHTEIGRVNTPEFNLDETASRSHVILSAGQRMLTLQDLDATNPAVVFSPIQSSPEAVPITWVRPSEG